MVEKNNNEIWVFLSHSNMESGKVTLRSESGTFFLDDEDIVQRFEPSEDNPIMEEKVEEPQAYYGFVVKKSIRHLIIPEGVKGFTPDFMRGVRVVERFELPAGLLGIGECCFANCILPDVIIPDSVESIGIFAFGHTHIESLQLPTTLQAPYGRQFKDSYIGMLKLPREWKDIATLGESGNLQIEGIWQPDSKYGYLRWPTTYIEKLELY